LKPSTSAVRYLMPVMVIFLVELRAAMAAPGA
jgi:hypothetical protein